MEWTPSPKLKVPTPKNTRALVNPLLWRYCEQNYLANPQHYLTLQDEHNINVNLLLLAEYLDQKSCYLSSQHWLLLPQAINDWEQNVLIPFRKIRRNTKVNNHKSQYQKVLEIELSMERQSQQMLTERLHQIADSMTIKEHSSSTNVDTYLNQLGLNETLVMPNISKR